MEMERFFSNYNKLLDSAIKPMWRLCWCFIALQNSIFSELSSFYEPYLWYKWRDLNESFFKNRFLSYLKVQKNRFANVAVFSQTTRGRCSTRRGSHSLFKCSIRSVFGTAALTYSSKKKIKMEKWSGFSNYQFRVKLFLLMMHKCLLKCIDLFQAYDF